MNLQQSHYFWLVVIAITVIGTIVAIRKFNPQQWGFKDVVKDPGYWENSDRIHQQHEAAAHAAKSWDDDKVASLTKHFILEVKSTRDEPGTVRILTELGDRTHRAVLEVLRDSSLHARLVIPTGTDILPEAPFNRACELLGDTPPQEFVEVLGPFLDDPSEGIRKHAALAIAKTGAPEITPFIRKAFADSDEYVRSYALIGLEYSLDRLPESVSVNLFPDVKRLLEDGKNADKAAAILYRFNATRAEEYFLSQTVFRVDSPILRETLKALADAKVRVSRERLQGLITALEATKLDYLRACALGEALRLLGQHRLPEDRSFLDSRMTHAEEPVAEGAAAGLLFSHGLDGFKERIWAAEEKSGYSSLLEHQRFYSVVFMCDAEINNGGFAQYFVNSSGDNWRDAVAGYEAMGFKHRLGIVKKALAHFGPDGPSENREIRQEQLSKLYKKNDSLFDDLGSRYYNSPEVIEVFATRFVVANPESFR